MQTLSACLGSCVVTQVRSLEEDENVGLHRARARRSRAEVLRAACALARMDLPVAGPEGQAFAGQVSRLQRALPAAHLEVLVSMAEEGRDAEALALQVGQLEVSCCRRRRCMLAASCNNMRTSGHSLRLPVR